MLSLTRVLAIALLLATALLLVAAGPEEVKAKAEAERAAISPEELARQIADNTIVNADLLPTRPPPKNYVATGEPEFALLLSPGLGKGCNLKKFPNLRQFLKEDAKYYPALEVSYFIATDPKLKFYATEAQRDNGMIHGSEMSEEDLLALLMAGPDETKEPVLSLELADNDPSVQELRDMMKQHGLTRAEQPNEDHTAMFIFKAGFTPVED